ncbi:hypothetical protein RFM68_22715 [Mesorhizobium sp. MSK_1335]|uniref:Uncharacterized protein n=1 Tax=Mesorhizobium montanum TaxID=3072323 RepID=A0ABU4ZPK7_9HYPH|nr:hypothetical protein [Mesorhizobium sp. MSK_1335]MDX8527318.1 hypothetical protein [Mesorhizobium sp. MSK_1335]
MHQDKDLKRDALLGFASRPQISTCEKTNSCRFRGLQLRAGTSRQPLSAVAARMVAVSWGEFLFFEDNSPFGNPD